MRFKVPRARRHPLLALTILALESVFGFLFAFTAVQVLRAAGQGIIGGTEELTRDGAHDLVQLLFRNAGHLPVVTAIFAVAGFLFLLCRPFLTLAFLVRLHGTRIRLVVARSAFLYGRALPIVCLSLLFEGMVSAALLFLGHSISDQFAVSQGEHSADLLALCAIALGVPLLVYGAVVRDLSMSFIAMGRRRTTSALRAAAVTAYTAKLRLSALHIMYTLAGFALLALAFWLAVRIGPGPAIAGFALRRVALSAIGVSRFAWLAEAARSTTAYGRAARTAALHGPSHDQASSSDEQALAP